MSSLAILTIFVLAVFVGFEVVSKVSTTLHTPLMSGANAIHGIILVGAIIVAAKAESTLGTVDRKSTRLNSSHSQQSRMPSSA